MPANHPPDAAMVPPTTVLLINPNTSHASTALMERLLRAQLAPGIAVETATAARGPAMITTEAELAQAADEVVAIGMAQVAQVARLAAIVIGAFGNPGLTRLRACSRVPVVGIGEAAMREAAAGGRRFGVATTTPGLDASIARAAQELGLAHCFRGTRVPDQDPLALAREPALQEACLAALVRACVQDGAEAVVIGGGPLAEAADQLGPRFAVPVINPVAAAGRAVLKRLRSAGG